MTTDIATIPLQEVIISGSEILKVVNYEFPKP
jgi:hypothetical protein